MRFAVDQDRHRNRLEKFRLLSKPAADRPPTPCTISRPGLASRGSRFATVARVIRLHLPLWRDLLRMRVGRATSAIPLSVSGFAEATPSKRPSRARYLKPDSDVRSHARCRGSISIPSESNQAG